MQILRLVLTLFMAVVILWVPSQTLTALERTLSEDEVKFTFFHLTDGESLLITTGRDKKILINTGSKESEEDLVSQLDELEVQQIDYLILTNKRETSCGNTDVIIDKYNVTNVVSSTNQPCVNIQTSNIQTEKWEKGQTYEPSPGLIFKVLKVNQQAENMSFYITFGKNSMVFMSEGNEAIEDIIKELPIQTEIIKIPDYAEKNFPSGELLDQLDPHIAIIYDLKDKKLHAGLIERMTELWIDVYHLKRVGTVQIIFTPSDYEFVRE
ncbi:Metal-dependent hydrolase, beta-lactamase superfamily II [Salinibacillus kushneri]|uniref:Metal-dependent hydrolase, beta-lactamase superfamily II n=1 Tax=Salinibacillus kushneri TaxID=237682 RepID=A0A1I0I2M0_9BACI|nr:hypothetical protein [Salinibacillus kushneri]SET90838.1 Metal-dependent hydrolase, beta-lactamase superfamily II [Salinibacillus kushneri]